MPLLSSGRLISKVRVSSGEEAKSLVSDATYQEAFAWSSVILPFLFPALGGLLFGYDIGATSGATISLQSPELSGTTWFNLSAVQLGLVVSGSLYGALFGSLLVYPITDFLGRRRELIIAAVLSALGGLITAYAPGLGVLLVGRLLYGLGLGLAMHGAPLYIAETCPSQIRGTLISLKELFIVLGILLGYFVGSFQINTVGGWRYMFGLSAPVALLMGIGSEFESIHNWRRFGLFSTDNWAAKCSVLCWSNPPTSDATCVSVVIGLFKLLMTGVAVLKVDDLGRRALLIGGVSGIALSLLLLSAYYKFLGGFPFVAVAALLLYVGCYQISFGPISWLMVSEIFPLRTRGKGISLAVLSNIGSNAIVTFAFLPLKELLGAENLFLLFGAIALISLVFVVLIVPETKGLSLEEIESKILK
ncbi:hypothetical protein F0562_000996 [Nyssa sinensis]|uniref:Major facilitator superfamily (MFS) profile domain-containing protein n=1 Tax=Nyssa sinensis TaxID=561372 RepID=A0A5J5C5U7_9ASTE|nr:hypothetical protein F0562_000996 [Nyssa sinensis]